MKPVNRKITYRMYPNSTQTALLNEVLALHCRTYNTLLEEHKRLYEEKGKSFSFGDMCKELTKWRGNVPSLDNLNAQSLQVTAKRVSLAFKAFFRRVKDGETPGFPRFKSLNRFTGWGYKTHGDGWRLFETPISEKSGKKSRKHTLRLSGIGNIRLRGKGRFSGTPKTAEISHKQGEWYLSVTFAVMPDELSRQSGREVAAFDWGIKNLLTIAKQDGSIELIDNPRWLKKTLVALSVLQRAVSKEEIKAKVSLGLKENEPIPKGTRMPVSSKMKRLYKQIVALHSKISRQRHDFYHKLSAILVSRFGLLGSEELDVLSMTKRPKPVQDPETGEYLPNGAASKANLNRNILDSAPAKLLTMIATKAEEAASIFSLADTRVIKPTQRCHKCGTLVPKELHERWHTCPTCLCSCDRDENAGKTLLRWLTEGKYWLTTPWAGTVQPCITGMEETPPIALV